METIIVPGGTITLGNSDFKCPKCDFLHTEKDYYKQLDKSKSGVIKKLCKSCKTWLGITVDMQSDVRVWLHTK